MKKWVIDNIITPIVLATALAAYRQVSHKPSDRKKLNDEPSSNKDVQENNHQE
jgi:hypothetical protein